MPSNWPVQEARESIALVISVIEVKAYDEIFRESDSFKLPVSNIPAEFTGKNMGNSSVHMFHVLLITMPLVGNGVGHQINFLPYVEHN